MAKGRNTTASFMQNWQNGQKALKLTHNLFPKDLPSNVTNVCTFFSAMKIPSPFVSLTCFTSDSPLVMNRNARPATTGETANVVLLDHPRNLYEHVTNDSCPPGMLHLLARANIASGQHNKNGCPHSGHVQRLTSFKRNAWSWFRDMHKVAKIHFKRNTHTQKEQNVLTRSLKIKYDKVGCLQKSWRFYIYSCSPKGWGWFLSIRKKTRNLAMMYPTRMVVHYIARAGKSTSLNGGLDVNWPLGRGEFPLCRCLLIPEWQLLFSDICSTSKLHHSRITTGTFQTFESHHNMIQDRCIGIGGWDSFHHVLCLTGHSGDGRKCHMYSYTYIYIWYVYM